MPRAKKAPALCPKDELRACLPRTRDGRCVWCQRELPPGYMDSLRAAEEAAPKRGPGRPPIPGLRQLAVRIDDPAAEGLAMAEKDHGTGPSEAVRMLLTAYGDSEEVRSAVSAWRTSRA